MIPKIFIFLAWIGLVAAENHFAGLTVSNSVSGTGSYTCRSQAQWNQAVDDAKRQGFGAIRIFGFDCNALNFASSAAAAAGVKILAGIYVDGTIAHGLNGINNDVQAFHTAYARYGAGRYIGLTVGNEVNDSSGNIMTRVNDIKAYLSTVGVKIPVSTVHTWVNIRDHPSLCNADFVGANAHAFYDGGRASGQAGDFIYKTVVPALKAACPGKKIYITESGWPSRGSRKADAVPSVVDEQQALRSLNCAARGDSDVSMYAFEYDDQLWKGDDNERSFGILGKINLANVFSSC